MCVPTRKLSHIAYNLQCSQLYGTGSDESRFKNYWSNSQWYATSYAIELIVWRATVMTSLLLVFAFLSSINEGLLSNCPLEEGLKATSK